MAQGLYDIQPLEALIQQGYTILTPNFRLARRIKTEWDAQHRAAGGKVWKPLPVKPLEDWLLEKWDLAVSLEVIPPLTPLGHPQVLELWRQVISEQAQRSADYQLVRTEAIAEMADQARELLLRWQVDSRAPQLQQLFQFERDCNTFLQWQRSFERRMAAAGLCTAVDCLVQLTRLTSPLSETRVVLVEFAQITPLLRAALTVVSPQWQEIIPAKKSSDRVVHAFSSKRAELQALAAWVAQQSREVPAQTIGVVLGNASSDRVALEYLLRREFDCLGQHYTSLPVNFSTGTPLVQVPLVRDALSALATALTHIAVPELVNLLHSRFLHAADTQTARTQQFIRRLYAHGRETLAIADVCKLTNNASTTGDDIPLLQHLRAIARMPVVKRKALPSAWPEHFTAILSLWGWPGAHSLDSVEYQQLEQWLRILDEFAAFDAVCGPIGFAHALTLLRDCCERQMFHPQTADGPIQVLGPLEAAGLAFDQLWVCGMQATNWPSPPRPNPFIPLVVQMQFNMPHANSERELAFSTGLLDQYSRNCRKLHASYCRQLEGVPELPSALLTGFTTKDMVEPDPVSTQWSAAYDGAIRASVADSQGPRLDCEAGTVLAGGSSLLEDQSQCAFRAYARHRLRVRPLPEFTTALSAGDRGSLLHAALSALWRQLGDSRRLASLDTAGEQQAVKAAIDTAIASMPTVKQQGLGNAFWALESRRLAIVLHEWLAVERQRSPFAVTATERETVLELGQFQLRLRIDRIDELPDGSQVVIDYKSAQSSVRDWLGERPPRPQLPLYAQARPDAVAALAFAQVRPRQCFYTGLGRVDAAPGIKTDLPLPVTTESLEQDWTSLNENWRRVLERLAEQFIAGHAQVDPYEKSICTSCGLQPLCRIDAATEAQAE
jgi:ATP-dependent helicase/nuclease subunit B